MLWKANIITYADSDLAKRGIDDGNCVPGLKGVGITVSELAGDVDIKEMHFAVKRGR